MLCATVRHRFSKRCGVCLFFVIGPARTGEPMVPRPKGREELMYPLLALSLVLALGAAMTLSTARALHDWAVSQHYSYELASTGELQLAAAREREKLILVRP